MNPRLKLAARSLTPPILWKAASWAFHTLTCEPSCRQSGERDEAWYNQVYREIDHYHAHYTASRYYFVWSVVADRITRNGATSVLDIGCGPGQFASLLRDKGMPRYCGVDLSNEAIRMARSLCPEYEFVAASVFETDVFDKFSYDVAVSLEFLEHVNDDIRVLQRISRGKRFLATVPNFPHDSHTRHFANSDEVVGRYSSLFDQFRVDVLLADEQGTTVYYLWEGVRL